MTAASKKALLKKLIESERDPAVLDLVDNVLQRRTRAVAFQSDMVHRVMRAKEDYKAGRFQTFAIRGRAEHGPLSFVAEVAGTEPDRPAIRDHGV